MKKQRKILSVILSIAMIFCMFPQMAFAGEEAAAASVDVTIRCQVAGGYLAGFDQKLTVSSQEAENYGLSDSVSGVSALDALVKAHEVVFGEAFTKETASEFLSASGGWISKLFGIETSANGFLINQGYPNDGTPSTYGGYNGTTVANQEIKSNDVIDFYTYLDDETWSDKYSFVDIDSQTADNLKVTVKGFYVMSGYLCKTPEEFKAKATPLANARLAWVDAKTGELIPISGCLTDENGQATIDAPVEEGVHYLVAVSNEDEDVYTVMNPTMVTVKPCTHIDANNDDFCDDCFKYCGSKPTTTQDVKLVLEKECDVTFHVGKDGKGAKIYSKKTDFDGQCYTYEITVPDGEYSCTVKDGDLNLGGVGFDMPLQTSIYEPTNIKLVLVKYYTTTTSVTINKVKIPVTIDDVNDFNLDLVAPGKCEIIPGDNYIDETIKSGTKYVVAPRIVWAYGNQILYNYTVELNDELSKDFGVSPVINGTFASTINAVQKKTFNIKALSTFTLHAPTDAKVEFYHQINNFNNMVLKGENRVVKADNGDGTSTYTVYYPSFSNASYRVSQDGYVTAAGYAKDKGTYTVTTDMDAVNADKGNKTRTVFPFRKDNENRDLATSTTTEIASKAGAGSNIEYENSVYLNIDDTKDTNELALKVGDTFRLRAYRAAWEIVNSVTANIMIEPDMNFKVLSGDDVVKVTPVTSRCTGNAKGNWMDIEALKEGTALITVWYDAIDVGGNTTLNGTYGATDPARYGYVLVNVGPDKTVTWNPVSHDGDWDAEFDTVYYFGDKGTFTIKPEGAKKVTVENINGTNKGAVQDVSANGSQYDVPVYSGSNLITVEMADGNDYMLVRAKKIEYTLENKTTGKTNKDPDFQVKVGDQLCLHFNQLNMPVAKMSGVYNPGYMGTAKTYYTLNEKYSLSSVGTQYDYITDAKSCITFTAQIPGENRLTGGYIQSGSMGDKYGNHRNMGEGGRGTNFSAVNVTGYFGSIEDITFNVEENQDASFNYADMVKFKKGSIFIGDSTYNHTGSFSITAKTGENNFVSYTKTTAQINAQDVFALKANVETANYYNDIKLRYWYEGKEPKEVDMVSGSDTIIPQSVLQPNADEILNIEVIVTPGNPTIGPAKVYSFVYLPGNGNLKYVHPIFKSLSAKAHDGETVEFEGQPLRYSTEKGHFELYASGDVVTLTGEMLQKYTNKTNKNQDQSDKVTVQKYKDGAKVGEEVVIQEAGGFPTGTWTADVDIAGADKLELVATSYVDNTTSRSITIDVHHSKQFTVNDATQEGGKASYFMNENSDKVWADVKCTQEADLVSLLEGLTNTAKEEREALEAQLAAETAAREALATQAGADKAALEAAIAAETAAREALAAQLEAEENARAALETLLETEKTDREAAIAAETAAREALAAQLEAEENTRAALETALATEKVAREALEAQLAAERTAREEAEQVVKEALAKLEKEQAKVKETQKKLEQKIAATKAPVRVKKVIVKKGAKRGTIVVKFAKVKNATKYKVLVKYGKKCKSVITKKNTITIKKLPSKAKVRVFVRGYNKYGIYGLYSSKKVGRVK